MNVAEWLFAPTDNSPPIAKAPAPEAARVISVNFTKIDS